jgi:nitrite reductase (NO-forming)
MSDRNVIADQVDPHAAPTGRCRARRRPVPPGHLRPTDVIGAYFLAGVGFGLAGASFAVVNAVDPWPWGKWLALHLLFIGGISQLVLGASQFFAGAFLATDPPARWLIRAQLLCWNAGTVGIAFGATRALAALTAVGAVLLLVALALYAAGFTMMRRRSLNSAPWASRWYLMAAAFLVPGVLAGASMANGHTWSHGNLLGAHMALNLAGWFGAAIVGTMHTFYPSLTRTQLRFPELQGPTYAAWGAGVAGLAFGYGYAEPGLVVAGWILLGIASALLATNVVGAVAIAVTPLSLPARLVGSGQLFLLAGVAVAAATAIDLGPEQALSGSTRAAVATLLVAGWIGLTVIGSLLHLLALLNRVRDLRRSMPAPHPAREAAIVTVAVVAVGALALGHLIGDGRPADVVVALVIGVYAGLGLRILQLAALAAARALPRI